MVDTQSKSYQLMHRIFESIFNKLSNTRDTLFYEVGYKPNFNQIYKEFINDSTAYNTFIDLSEAEKIDFGRRWIVNNVFYEAIADVEYKLMEEYETIPFNIQYKINNSYNVLEEGIYTALGIGAAFLASTQLLPDSWRKIFQDISEKIGRFIATVLTLDFGVLSTKNEILNQINAEKLADSVKECQSINNFNPAHSSKVTRAWHRVINDNREYEYASCIGNKIINYYKTVLISVYNILKAKSIDKRVIDAFQNSLTSGRVSHYAFVNVGRLIRDRKSKLLFKTLDDLNKAISNLIDAFVNSNDGEYKRIGIELSKKYDQMFTDVAQTLKRDRSRPPMNERDREMVAKQTGNVPPARDQVIRDRGDRYKGPQNVGNSRPGTNPF